MTNSSADEVRADRSTKVPVATAEPSTTPKSMTGAEVVLFIASSLHRNEPRQSGRHRTPAAQGRRWAHRRVNRQRTIAAPAGPARERAERQGLTYSCECFM